MNCGSPLTPFSIAIVDHTYDRAFPVAAAWLWKSQPSALPRRGKSRPRRPRWYGIVWWWRIMKISEAVQLVNVHAEICTFTISVLCIICVCVVYILLVLCSITSVWIHAPNLVWRCIMAMRRCPHDQKSTRHQMNVETKTASISETNRYLDQIWYISSKFKMAAATILDFQVKWFCKFRHVQSVGLEFCAKFGSNICHSHRDERCLRSRRSFNDVTRINFRFRLLIIGSSPHGHVASAHQIWCK